MSNRASILAALFVASTLSSVVPAAAIDGEIIITHAKAGNVTPGDLPGYPVTISQAGSYKLGGNLLPPLNTNGINITGPFVTINMNGFMLYGAKKAFFGVYSNNIGSRIENSTIAHFKSNGITGHGSSLTVENVLSTGNGDDGVRVDADFARVVNSTVSENGGSGITCIAASCHIEGNVASKNGIHGIVVYSGTVLGNTIAGNALRGLYATDVTGFGNNTFVDNNGGLAQVFGNKLIGLQPNVCSPACP